MWDWIEKLQDLKAQAIPATMVTLVGTQGSSPRDTGAKMIVLESGEFFGTIGGGKMEQLALEEARRCLASGNSKLMKIPLAAKAGQCCGGTVDLFFEPIGMESSLFVFGAGHVGLALCETLQGTPFRVHLIDERHAWIHSPKIPRDVHCHACDWEDFVYEASWSASKTFVAIMTHSHDRDQDIVAAVIRRPTRFIGLIGSHAKWGRFQRRLIDRKFTSLELSKVSCPIGLKTGGKAPKEVAVSIAAQLLQVHHGAT